MPAQVETHRTHREARAGLVGHPHRRSLAPTSRSCRRATAAYEINRTIAAVAVAGLDRVGLVSGRTSLGVGVAVTEPFVSQTEAARLAGCSKDTIVRARRSGRLPHARLRGHQWAIALDDLVAAGLYQPAGQEPGAATPSPMEEAAEPVSVELARALARVAALEDVVARQDDELRFLRQLTVETLGKRSNA